MDRTCSSQSCSTGTCPTSSISEPTVRSWSGDALESPANGVARRVGERVEHRGETLREVRVAVAEEGLHGSYDDGTARRGGGDDGESQGNVDGGGELSG